VPFIVKIFLIDWDCHTRRRLFEAFRSIRSVTGYCFVICLFLDHGACVRQAMWRQTEQNPTLREAVGRWPVCLHWLFSLLTRYAPYVTKETLWVITFRDRGRQIREG